MSRDSYQMMTYKNRLDNLRRLYKDSEVSLSPLISDYTCAVLAGSPKILQQGRMYITVHFVCFYCRLLRYEQKIIIHMKEIADLTKEKTALVFPNAIQVVTKNDERYFFTSFTTRDRTYHIINKLWSENKSGIELSSAAIWDRIRLNYGNDLGFAVNDPEYHKSKATLFTARYSRRPSEIHESSSQEDSIYESFDDSVSNDSREDLPPDSSFHNHKNGIHRKESYKLKLIDEDVKFDLFKSDSKDTETSLPDDNLVLPTTEITLDPASCVGHDHYPTVTLDEEFNIDVTTLWTLLFTDSIFYRALCATRMIVNVTQSNWSEISDTDTGICRTIYYTVNLKNKIGPKQSPTVEKQVLLSGSKENYIYLVESMVKTVGIPLSDSFHVMILYCLLYVNPARSRLKMSMKVTYDKSVFFATKSIIESTVKSSCLDYNKDLKSSLIRESRMVSTHSPEETVYHSIAGIADSYKAPIIESYAEIYDENKGISGPVTHNTSWMLMVVICCTAFLLFYMTNMVFSGGSESQIIPISYDQTPQESSSINEIMDLIHEMKSAIEVIKKNIETLNRSNPCTTAVQSCSVN